MRPGNRDRDGGPTETPQQGGAHRFAHTDCVPVVRRHFNHGLFAPCYELETRGPGASAKRGPTVSGSVGWFGATSRTLPASSVARQGAAARTLHWSSSPRETRSIEPVRTRPSLSRAST